MSNVSCGRDYTYCSELSSSLEEASKAGFDFICVPIVHPRYERHAATTSDSKEPFTRSDLLLNSSDWSSLILGKVSPWLQLDSPIQSVRRNSEQALKQELDYATYLSLPAVMIPLKSRKFHNLARFLSQRLTSPFLQQKLWIRVPLKSPRDCIDRDVIDFDPATGDAGDDADGATDDTWQWWRTFHTMCNASTKMGVALEITADLPAGDVLQRWLAEPIVCAVLSTKIFLTNKNGFPVLSRAHQEYLHQLFKLNVQLVLTGSEQWSDGGLLVYHQYLDHLWKTQPEPDIVAQFARGYEDFLQCPLQPLMDNLESQTYEIFEKDPVKYSQYQLAMYHAILDKVPFEDKDTVTLVLMVVGAGRGPIVRAAIKAAQRADRSIRIYAVEKNPNAIVTLLHLKKDLWGDDVTIVSCDMREWQAPEKADILVSELLGSFGDNELSPECLDGAQRFLKDDGISIPTDYTSYLTPLQSSKLYNEVRLNKEQNKSPKAHYETPYVVKLHNCRTLAEPKPVFTFHHPNKAVPIDNTRYISLKFDIPHRGLLHGFSGYFECTLYKDVTLSILPSTHSHGMCSWFPILFPIFHPVYLEDNSTVRLDFWRCCTTKNVWYEWCLLEPEVLPIHNPNGRSYTIGL